MHHAHTAKACVTLIYSTTAADLNLVHHQEESTIFFTSQQFESDRAPCQFEGKERVRDLEAFRKEPRR
jgi:hypothetical protein